MTDDLPSLFRQVADLSPSDRRAWFEERGVAAGLREEVESLLLFDDAAEPRLTQSVAKTLQRNTCAPRS